MRYGVSYGNGNDGVSKMYPSFVVNCENDKSDFTDESDLIAKLAILTCGKASRKYLRNNAESDYSSIEHYASWYVSNPPRNPNWSEANGSWICVEVFPADEEQSELSQAPEYDSLEAAFGRQLVTAHKRL